MIGRRNLHADGVAVAVMMISVELRDGHGARDEVPEVRWHRSAAGGNRLRLVLLPQPRLVADKLLDRAMGKRKSRLIQPPLSDHSVRTRFAHHANVNLFR
jgi:hypothetical protein